MLHRYAEYEAKLEELRSHRMEIMGIKRQTTLAEYAIVKRIHLIYERATRKFRGDLRIWLKWLHFCRTSGSNRQTSRVSSIINHLQLFTYSNRLRCSSSNTVAAVATAITSTSEWSLFRP